MKITFLLISIERRGGVRVTAEIANQLAKLKHKCSLIVAGNNAIPFPVHEDVQIIHTQCTRLTGNFGTVSKVFTLAKAVPADSDIVVATYYLTAYSAIIARLRARRAKLFYLVQGYEPNFFRQKNMRIQGVSYLLARFSYYLPLHKTTISHWLSDVLATHGHHDVPVINNGIDTEIFAQGIVTPSSSESVIMTVANPPNRGFYDFCASMDIIKISRTDFRVLIIGSDPDVASALNVPYDFLTPRSDEELVSAYNKSSIYVSCSHEEGFGLMPLEAMSCGTPVVCTDSGGLRDYARSGENCLMVPVGDVNKIAEAIIQLLDDAELRVRFVEQGRKTASRFVWADIGRQYEKLFLQTR